MTAPDGNALNLACGQSYIVDLVAMGGTSIVKPHTGYDLIYYEWPSAPGILLDWVIVEICPDSACATRYQVFNWGNASADLNTNIGASYGPPEIDNQPIPNADLYGTPPFQTGIAIDIDALGSVPDGTYPYVRLYSPLGGDNDAAQIDALVVVFP